MCIVDEHHHIGERGLKDTVFGWQEDIEDVIKAMDKFGVDTTILQPLGGAHDPIKVHNEIYQYSQSYLGRIFGLVSMNPKVYGKEKTIAEIERCVNDLGFVGIKLHTLAHGIDPTSEIGDYIFETANITPRDSLFIKTVSQTVRDVLKIEPEFYVGRGGVTDARFYRYMGVPTIIYGPNEYVDISTLEKQAKVYLGL